MSDTGLEVRKGVPILPLRDVVVYPHMVIPLFVGREKSKLALDEESVRFYWQLAEHVVPTLYRLKGDTRPLPFVEDVAVPPAELPNFLVTLQNVLKQHQITASLFAHAGHGQPAAHDQCRQLAGPQRTI